MSLLTTKQVEKVLGFSREKVRYLYNTSKIKGFRLSKKRNARIYYTSESIQHFLNEERAKPVQKAVLSIRGVSKILAVSVMTLRRWHHNGFLLAAVIPRGSKYQLMYDPEKIEAFIKEREALN